MALSKYEVEYTDLDFSLKDHHLPKVCTLRHKYLSEACNLLYFRLGLTPDKRRELRKGISSFCCCDGSECRFDIHFPPQCTRTRMFGMTSNVEVIFFIKYASELLNHYDQLDKSIGELYRNKVYVDRGHVFSLTQSHDDFLKAEKEFKINQMKEAIKEVNKLFHIFRLSFYENISDTHKRLLDHGIPILLESSDARQALKDVYELISYFEKQDKEYYEYTLQKSKTAGIPTVEQGAKKKQKL
mgnify:CR=1 FL=1